MSETSRISEDVKGLDSSGTSGSIVAENSESTDRADRQCEVVSGLENSGTSGLTVEAKNVERRSEQGRAIQVNHKMMDVEITGRIRRADNKVHDPGIKWTGEFEDLYNGTSGYWQVLMQSEDQDNTTFCTRYGQRGI
jgi:hypothetical protein